MLDVGALWMHIVGGIRGALLGDLALAGDLAHQMQPRLKLLGRQIVELPFEFESAMIRRPHVSSITSSGVTPDAATSACRAVKITDVTGHRSLEMLKTYSRDAEAFVGHAGARDCSEFEFLVE
jgi:hypothetical protein